MTLTLGNAFRQRPPVQHSTGFTLVELLAVLVVVGIVTAAIVAFSADGYRKTQLRDGATQLVADLNRARAQAQRTSASSVVTLTAAVGTPDANYKTQWAGAATATSKALAAPIRVAPYNSTYSLNTITYSAPYGEVQATGILWEVSSLSTATKLYIKAVGVTGKVILSATPN